MKTTLGTVADWIAGLPENRRAVVNAVRDLVNRKLPKGYVETVSGGMLAWAVPVERYPDTYNGKPLLYAALGNTKQGLSLHLMSVYNEPKLARELREGFAKAGKRLDMGKACVRFRTLEDLHLPLIGRLLAAVPGAEFIRRARMASDPDLRQQARVRAARRSAAMSGVPRHRGPTH